MAEFCQAIGLICIGFMAGVVMMFTAKLEEEKPARGHTRRARKN